LADVVDGQGAQLQLVLATAVGAGFISIALLIPASILASANLLRVGATPDRQPPL
jgi:hypothetical protein